jgi:uncharacterized DUF497 family protein
MFHWDAGNVDHIAKHGITPAEAEQVILNNPFDLELQVRNGETRIPQLGETDGGRVLVVVTTMHSGGNGISGRCKAQEVLLHPEGKYV